MQHGNSGPPPEDILEDNDGDDDDDDSDALSDDQPSMQAPIGTRPSAGSKRPVTPTPKLNPAAKDFTSFFARMKTSAKDKDKDAAASSSKTNAMSLTSTSSNTPNHLTQDPSHDDSPPNSRKSRDTRSVTTAESSLLESSRNSLDRTASYSNASDAAPTPSNLSVSTGKESFMQKITRKSSSGKFSLPTFKREKSRLDGGGAGSSKFDAGGTTPMQEDWPEDDPLSASASSFDGGRREGREANRGSGRSWSSVLKRGKKEGRKGETPSLSSVSLASEDREEDEE